MAYATVADVEKRLGRELTPEEEAQVAEMLEDIEALIRLRIPNLDQQIDSGKIPERVLVMVEVNAVLRVLRNPDAFISETDGNYSYTRASDGVSGYLDLLPIEWDWLFGRGSGMFQLVPVSPHDSRYGREGFTRQPDAHEIWPPSWGWVVRVP